MTKPDPSLKSLLQKLQSQLTPLSDSPYLDALVLASHVTLLTKSQLLADPKLTLTRDQNNQLEMALNKIRSGIPLPYVLGQWEFYQLPININQDVLIPRPETEGMVERALAWLDNNTDKVNCLELGTGSGCIAVALAKNHSKLIITASDISQKALNIARENSRLLAVDNQIEFIQTNLLEGIQKKYDLLVANLPYIPTEKLKTLKVYQSEPLIALDGGPDGLSFIRNVLQEVSNVLLPGALILMELDEDCGQQVLNLSRTILPDAMASLDQDLSGQDRYLVIQT